MVLLFPSGESGASAAQGAGGPGAISAGRIPGGLFGTLKRVTNAQRSEERKRGTRCA